MDDNKPATDRRQRRQLAGAVALLAGGALAGGILVTSLSASAESTSTATQSPSATASAGPGRPDHGAAAVRPGETALTGSNAEKARAAALKAVPGGTVYRVETDADGDAYEAHMTKSDGSEVTVKLDKNFKVLRVEEGMGRGGHR